MCLFYRKPVVQRKVAKPFVNPLWREVLVSSGKAVKIKTIKRIVMAIPLAEILFKR